MAEKSKKSNQKNNKNNLQKGDGKAFILRRILPLSIVLLVTLIAIYLCFLPEKWIPLGTDLTRSDWLSFLGAYLSFSGAIMVSLFVFWHAIYVSQREAKKAEEERKKKYSLFSL